MGVDDFFTELTQRSHSKGLGCAIIIVSAASMHNWMHRSQFGGLGRAIFMDVDRCCAELSTELALCQDISAAFKGLQGFSLALRGHPFVPPLNHPLGKKDK